MRTLQLSGIARVVMLVAFIVHGTFSRCQASRLVERLLDLAPPKTESGLTMVNGGLSRDVSNVKIEIGGGHSSQGAYSWKFRDTLNNDAVILQDTGTALDCHAPRSIVPLRATIELGRMYSIQFTADLNSMYMVRVMPMATAGFRPDKGDFIINEQYTVLIRKRPEGGIFDPRWIDNGVDQNLAAAAFEEAAPDCPQGGGGQPHPAPCVARAVIWDFVVVPKEIKNSKDDPLVLNYGEYTGDSSIPELGVGKSGSTDVSSFAWAVSIGGGKYGTKAGEIVLRGNQLTPTVYTPAILSLERNSQNPDDLDTIYESAGSPVLRQVRGPQALADILRGAPGTDKFEIYLYAPGNFTPTVQPGGLYGVTSGSHFVKYTLSKLAPTATGVLRLEIKEERYQNVNTWEIRYEPPILSPPTAAKWSRITGDPAINEQQILTREISFLANGDRKEAVTLKYNNSTSPAFEAVVTLHSYAWGWEVIREEYNPGPSAIIKDYTFYQSTDPADSFYKEKLQSMVCNDGYQEWYQYRGDSAWEGSGWLYRVYRPWGDTQFTVGNPATTSFAWTEYSHNDGSSRGAPCLVTEIVKDSAGLLSTLSARGQHSEPASKWIKMHDAIGRAANNTPVGGGHEGATDSYTYTYSPAQDPASGFEYWPNWKKQQIRFQQHGDRTVDAFSYSRGSYSPATRLFSVDNNNGTYWRVEQVSGTFNPGGLPEETPLLFSYTFGDDGALPGFKLKLLRAASTKKVTVRDDQGHLVLEEVYVFDPPSNLVGTSSPASDSHFALVQQLVHAYDALSHLTQTTYYDATAAGVSRVIYSAAWLDAQNNPAKRKSTETDEVGVIVNFGYDSLDKLKTLTKKGVVATGGFPAQVDIVSTLTYDANGKQISKTTQAGTLSKTESATYDRAGRPLTQVSEEGLTTSFSFANGGRDVTTTLPGTGFTSIRKNYLDRRLKEVSGTAQIPEFYTYETGQYWESLITKKTLGTSGGQRWTKQWTSTAGVTTQTMAPAVQAAGDPLATTQVYNLDGRLIKTQPPALNNTSLPAIPDSADTETGYDPLGRPMLHGRGGLFPTAKRLSAEWTTYERLDNGTHWFLVKRSTNLISGWANGSVTILADRVSGFSSTLGSESWVTDPLGQITKTTRVITRSQAKLVETVDVPEATAHRVTTTINGLLQRVIEPGTSAANYTYDSLGREKTVVAATGATHSRTYETGNNRVATRTDPAGNVESIAYYAAGDPSSDSYPGRIKSITRADGTITYFGYNRLGLTTRTWGSASYPEERVYNVLGELVQLKLYRSTSINWNTSTWPSGATNPDITEWTYDPSTGLVLSKIDAALKSITYSYYPDGRPYQQGYPRKSGNATVYVYRTFEHDSIGAVKTTYSDGTPSVEYQNYDLRGLPGVVIDARGQFSLSYDLLGRKVKENCTSPGAGLGSGTAFENFCVETHYDPAYGEDYVQAAKVDLNGNPVAIHLNHSYGYNAISGRLTSVANTAAGASVNYTYLGSTDLLDTTTFNHTPTPTKSWYTRRNWEFGFRLQSIQNVIGGATFDASAYEYDTLNRRTRKAQVDGSAWAYDYNQRDEVLAGKRSWVDRELVAGQQFEYGYDAEGNRLSTKRGGDSNGENLHQETFTANNLNQITPSAVDNKVDVVGLATATSTPQVNGVTAYRKGEYFHQAVTVENSASSVAQDITVSMAGVSSLTGKTDVRKAGASYVWDYDGTLLDDGLWMYSWDAEGRLQSMESVTTLSPASAKRKLTFCYDSQGRRCKKVVQTWNGSTYGAGTATYFIYAGWRLLGEFDSNAQPIRTYMWGLDLSGSTEGAGTVGGLVMVRDHATGANYFPAYDGNGNVTGLVKASDLSLAAIYEYGPFGELLRSSGPMAGSNPIRFSSKFQDDETGLLYYGYRYYEPRSGRWLSRDPMEEDHGPGFYRFCNNSSTYAFDPDGRSVKYPGGHHVHPVSQALMQDMPSGPGKGILESFTIEVNAEHKWNRHHVLYNKAVRRFRDIWLRENNYNLAVLANNEQVAKDLLRDLLRAPSSSGVGGYLGRVEADGGIERGLSKLGKYAPAMGVALGFLMVESSAIAAYQDALVLGPSGEVIIARSMESNVADFIRHSDEGDVSWADLDVAVAAAEYSISQGGDSFGALLFWNRLQDIYNLDTIGGSNESE